MVLGTSWLGMTWLGYELTGTLQKLANISRWRGSQAVLVGRHVRTV